MTTKKPKPVAKTSGKKAEAVPPHELMVSTVTQNAAAMQRWSAYGETDINELVRELGAKVNKVQEGDMSQPEVMLYGQAMALQAIFTSLSARSAMNVGEYIGAAEIYMRLALRAQAQCRATLETLAFVKNPQPYIRQANIAHGPQQVNNSTAGPSHAENFKSEQNKLLEHQHGDYLVTGAQGATVETDSHMEAMGQRDWAKDG